MVKLKSLKYLDLVPMMVKIFLDSLFKQKIIISKSLGMKKNKS